MLSTPHLRAIVLAVALAAPACRGTDEPPPQSDPPAATPTPMTSTPGPVASPSASPARTSTPAPAPSAPATATFVSLQWSFPALVSDTARGLVFPTYMAHLLGHPLDHPFPTDLVCVDVDNPGPAFTATLTIKMAIYGEDAA